MHELLCGSLVNGEARRGEAAGYRLMLSSGMLLLKYYPVLTESDQLYLTRRFTEPQQLAAAATHLRNRLDRVGQQPRVYAAPAGKDRPRRGIVIPAGGRKLFANAFVVVKVGSLLQEDVCICSIKAL